MKYDYVDTTHSIIDAEISRDSTRTLTVTKASEKECYVKMFSLETLEMTFCEKFTGKYLKMKNIV
jgi:hypothetical protein